MDSLTPQDLTELEHRAEGILARVSDRSAPLVVELAGSPKSGKSTAIDILDHFFRRIGFRTWAPSEGASKRTPYHLRRNLVAFNTWTLNYAISELLAAYYSVDPPHIVFLDRGPFDSLAWMGLLCKRGELTPDEYKILEEFALHPKWIRLISKLFLFTCQPEVSLRRETEAKLTTRKGTAMNEQLLSDLLAEYEELESRLVDYPIRRVRTSFATTARETAYELASDLMVALDASVQ